MVASRRADRAALDVVLTRKRRHFARSYRKRKPCARLDVSPCSGRFANMSALLFINAVAIIFVIGLTDEQITTLIFKNPARQGD